MNDRPDIIPNKINTFEKRVIVPNNISVLKDESLVDGNIVKFDLEYMKD